MGGWPVGWVPYLWDKEKKIQGVGTSSVFIYIYDWLTEGSSTVRVYMSHHSMWMRHLKRKES